MTASCQRGRPNEPRLGCRVCGTDFCRFLFRTRTRDPSLPCIAGRNRWQPGIAEKSIATHDTHERAVMCDTLHPLKLTKFAKDLDNGKYAYSWYENAQEGAAGDDASADGEGDASGAGLTSHF
jgi:hypothetical protein